MKTELKAPLFTVCEHGVIVIEVVDGLTIRHDSDVRTFSWFELSSTESNIVEEWFDQLHQEPKVVVE